MSKYTITQGKHSYFHIPKIRVGSPAQRTYKIAFSQSCWYDPTSDWERDWNKVVGYTTALFPYLPKEGDTHYKGRPHKWYRISDWEPSHHYNSLRLASRAGGTKDDPILELALYAYQEGKLTILPLDHPYQYEEDLLVTLQATPQLSVTASYGDGHYEQEVLAPGTIPQGSGWILYPYVGGDNVAAQDYVLWVERLSPTSLLNSLSNWFSQKFTPKS